MINLNPTILPTSVLVTDTYQPAGGSPDSILPKLTQVAGSNVSAAFEIRSTSGGVLFPRMTTAQVNALNSTGGLVAYDATLDVFKFKQGAAWVQFSTGGGGGYGPGVPTFIQDTNGTTNNFSIGTPEPAFLGSKNTVAGINAGTFVGTFNDSCFFGYNANPDVDGLTNACAIGSDSAVSVSNAIVLGTTDVVTKVGIGTKSPEQILHVANGDAVFTGKVGAGTTAPSTRLHVKDGVSYFQNSNVGIGVANPTEALHVFGTVQFESAGTDTSSGLYIKQFGGAGTTVIPFPLDITTSFQAVIVRVTISVFSATEASYGTSLAAAKWNGSTESVGVLPAITLTGDALGVSASWLINDNSLCLVINDAIQWLVVAEYFYDNINA